MAVASENLIERISGVGSWQMMEEPSSSRLSEVTCSKLRQFSGGAESQEFS
jgi:hypothetical protein